MKKSHRAVAVYILNSKDEFLLLYHKKLNTYLPPGGHVEENELIHQARQREAIEEAGVEIEFLNVFKDLGDDRAEQLPTPIFVQLEDIGDHYHEDFIYLARAKSNEIKNNEGHSDIGWFSKDEALKLKLFENVMKQIQFIYNKLNK